MAKQGSNTLAQGEPRESRPSLHIAVKRRMRRCAGRGAAVPRPGEAGSEAMALACGLYHATLELLDASDQPSRDSHRLVNPLSQVVARQGTRRGQADCASFAQALRAGDDAAALDASAAA